MLLTGTGWESALALGATRPRKPGTADRARRTEESIRCEGATGTQVFDAARPRRLRLALNRAGRLAQSAGQRALISPNQPRLATTYAQRLARAGQSAPPRRCGPPSGPLRSR